MEMVVRLQTEKDLEDKRIRRVSVLPLFSLFFSIDFWMSERQISREDIADIIHKRQTQQSDTESSQKEVLCRGWKELGPTQNPVAHCGKGLRLARHGHQQWLTIGECSTRDAIHVLESVEKYAVVNCVKGSWKIQECQKRNIVRVKCKENVICYFEKGCFSTMVRVVSWLRRTDEVVFSKVGKKLLEEIFLGDFWHKRLETGRKFFQIIWVKRSFLEERFYYRWSESQCESTRWQRETDDVCKSWEHVIKKFKME